LQRRCPQLRAGRSARPQPHAGHGHLHRPPAGGHIQRGAGAGGVGQRGVRSRPRRGIPGRVLPPAGASRHGRYGLARRAAPRTAPKRPRQAHRGDRQLGALVAHARSLRGASWTLAPGVTPCLLAPHAEHARDAEVAAMAARVFSRRVGRVLFFNGYFVA